MDLYMYPERSVEAEILNEGLGMVLFFMNRKCYGIYCIQWNPLWPINWLLLSMLL